MVSFPAKRSLCENPGIPGEKSLNLNQISPRILVEMTVAGYVISHYA